MGKTENKFQEEVVNYLRTEIGGIWWTNSPSSYTEGGRPDVEGLRKGIFYGFELKKYKGGKRDPLQRETLTRINMNGGVGMFVNHLDIIKELFNRT